ncbi:MAG: glucose-1-phosphate adenylyltransferase [Chloroflexi bacterium]|nr:glucose-1-phosphate adenylyltransferase [Chloroflexota bacterium]
MERVLAIIMAGGLGERLKPLTRERAKAAVPFGGKFRLIDFTLTNCINSGVRRIFVLTQYRSESLHRHIQEGWGISSSGLGDYIYCVPPQQKLGAEWYRGTADAVRQNLDLVRRRDVEHVLVLSGDHIYKMDYLQMVAYHKRKNAGLTIAAIRVARDKAANKLGVIEVDEDYRMVGFEEKPAQPNTIPGAPDYALASMGVYIFKEATLREALLGQEDDFGKDVIPRMIGDHRDIFVYDYERENKIEDYIVEVREGRRNKVLVDRTRDSPYWKDVGTIDSYYEASMDLIGVDPLFNLYGEKWPLRTYQRPLPPSKCIIGGKALESIMCDGCIISGGTAWRSILSPGVIVEREALVDESIIFDDVIIEPYARVRRAIVDKEVRIQSGASVGYDHQADIKRGCTISEGGIVVVPRGVDISPVYPLFD